MTSTGCASWSGTARSPTSAFPTGRLSVRRTRTCSRAGCGRCCSTPSSTRSREERGGEDRQRSQVRRRRLHPVRGALPGRRPGSLRAHRSLRDRRPARRTPVRAGAPRADPGAARIPAGVLDYSDLLLSTFTPLRPPVDWPRYAQDLDAAADGDASALETAARQMLIALRIRQVDEVNRDLVSGRSCRAAGQRLAEGHRARQRTGQAVGTVPSLDAMGSVRGQLAGARHRALHRTVERQDQDPDPAHQQRV